jgi:hypothetical protein
MSFFVNSAMILFVLTAVVIVPTIHGGIILHTFSVHTSYKNISNWLIDPIQCYGATKNLIACDGNCFQAKCDNGVICNIDYVTFISLVLFKNLGKGAAGHDSHNKMVNFLESECPKDGGSYQAGSLKFCNCDRCNGDVMTCEVSGPAWWQKERKKIPDHCWIPGEMLKKC